MQLRINTHLPAQENWTALMIPYQRSSLADTLIHFDLRVSTRERLHDVFKHQSVMGDGRLFFEENRKTRFCAILTVDTIRGRLPLPNSNTMH